VDGWNFNRWKGGEGGLSVGRIGGVGGKGEGVAVIYRQEKCWQLWR